MPSELQALLRTGGVPRSIDHLRLMETQQNSVSKAAESCTVSVQIGPAQGCGVIITESGFILTAAHVAMRPGKSALVTLSTGRTVRARTLGMYRKVDAGLMKIDPDQNGGNPWSHASLGTSEDLMAGMWCIATGHPGGYDPDRGIVTRVGRILRVREGAIETDCALIGGDSGGPLFDLSGRLIAVHSRIGNDVSENLHVPVDYYGKYWNQMRDGEAWGFLPGFRPVLGVTGSPNSERAIVDVVRPGSPAEDAGIERGDVVEQFGDVPIKDFASLKAAVDDTMPGERVAIWINRDGSRKRVSVEVGRAD
ncbi:Putative serine protease HhoA precursor [Rubripirellula lacrimiformis]|uniref:Serine protease HhoA n=1 Tax=Rubripirellula lacrimiformis TaxID=1930273 RepID=A0A517N997_9BACT|nr:Putative serine protease HhoA precursor [Rubripirellula lacrimiformis]